MRTKIIFTLSCAGVMWAQNLEEVELELNPRHTSYRTTEARFRVSAKGIELAAEFRAHEGWLGITKKIQFAKLNLSPGLFVLRTKPSLGVGWERNHGAVYTHGVVIFAFAKPTVLGRADLGAYLHGRLHGFRLGVTAELNPSPRKWGAGPHLKKWVGKGTEMFFGYLWSPTTTTPSGGWFVGAKFTHQ